MNGIGLFNSHYCDTETNPFFYFPVCYQMHHSMLLFCPLLNLKWIWSHKRQRQKEISSSYQLWLAFIWAIFHFFLEWKMFRYRTSTNYLCFVLTEGRNYYSLVQLTYMPNLTLVISLDRIDQLTDWSIINKKELGLVSMCTKSSLQKWTTRSLF